MNDAAVAIDLTTLRRSCSRCSLQALCLPASIEGGDLERLDRIVLNRRPLQRGDALYRSGQALGSLYVAREGAFKTVALDPGGATQVLGFHLPGELLGLDALGRRTDAAGVRRTAAVLGVRYRQLANGEFNHSSVLILLDADGRVVARTEKLGPVPDPAFVAKVRAAIAKS